MKPWPKVSLGELLQLERRKVKVEPEKLYQEIGIYCFGRGIFHKTPRTGFEVGDKDLFLMKEGDFILQVTFAWEGAIAIVSAAEDGMYGSTRYPTFRVDETLCAPKFLLNYFKTEEGLQQLVKICPGSAGRNRVLSIKRIPEVLVPLPPLAEQRRVVARIEELAAQIHEARTLRHQAAEEAEALHLSVLHQHFVTESLGWTPMPMDEAIQINDKQVDPTLPEYSKLPHISGENMEGKTCRLLPWRTAEVDGVKSKNYLFAPGTILYSKIRPYLRKAVFVDFRGVCSADVYPVRLKSPKLDPQFVKWAFVAEPFTEYANRMSGRTRMPKLNRKQLFSFNFSHPPIEEQRRIVAELDVLQAEVDALKRLQAETAAELDALLPSILDKAFKGEL
jgi:type I restriction enzyme, S subunit